MNEVRTIIHFAVNPLIILSVLGIIALFAEIFRFRKGLFPLILLGLAGAFVCTARLYNHPQIIMGMMNFDNYAVVFTCVILIIAFLWFMMAKNYFLQETSVTDHFALIIFSLVGAVVMVSFNNLTMLFLGIEILSVSVYVLAASDKTNITSSESGFKYFLMGSFATGFLLFGITLIYGVTGSFDLTTIQHNLSSGNETGLALAGVLLLLVGLGFKSSLAPFHFWAPDVYEGAPTTVTTYMATVVKTAAFAAFYRLFSLCFWQLAPHWADILSWMVVLTLFIGNVSAVRQKSVKRLLAYSSVAHAGYIAIAIVAMSTPSTSAIMYYTFTYSISSLSAFTILFIVSRHKGSKDISAFEGMSKANPLLSFAMTVAMLSLAGIPPTAGFFAKYYVFFTAINHGYTWLVLVAVIAALVGVYYYFRVIIAIYFKPEQQLVPIKVGPLHRTVLIITTILTLLFGLFPNLVLGWL